jgi:uncharacterized OsmC-like protein
MSLEQIALAQQRLKNILERRPSMGLDDDAPASVKWHQGLRFVASHANGKQMQTDMPAELGGTGDQVTPGWLFRAGIAACTSTSIVLAAAREGILLDELDVKVSGRSDTRGLLGMSDEQQQLVNPAPQDMRMEIKIAARNVDAEKLRELVETGCRCSPIANAVPQAIPIPLRVEVKEL